MKLVKSALFAVSMLSAVSATAAEVSGNIALTSDYFFRGIDQAGGPAISGGFDASFENGAYLGTWASSVDFGGGVELDYYVDTVVPSLIQSHTMLVIYHTAILKLLKERHTNSMSSTAVFPSAM